MELDPEIAAALKVVGDRLIQSDLDTMEGVIAMRKEVDRIGELFNATLDRSGVVTDSRIIPGPPGAPELAIRIHRPSETTPDARPCLFHVHGGGMVAGSARRDDGMLLGIVRTLGCVATSVEYRLAPEHRAPAMSTDCYWALKWVCANARSLGIDPERIVLGGISGGGGVAAAAALMARDLGGTKLCLQWLITPQLDDRNDTPSAHGDWIGWPRRLNVGAWKAVLGERYGTDKVTAYDSAARAQDLTGLPPTYIEVASMEVFRDEGIDYASRLLRAGVQTELHVYAGGFHGFHLFAPEARLSKLAAEARVSALRRAWWPEKL